MEPRVAHVISSPEGLGGAELVLAQLIAGGADRGWQQQVVQLFARGGGRELAEAVSPAAEHRPLPAKSARDLLGLRRQLDTVLDTFRPDVVHAHLFHAGVAVASLRSRPGVLRIWTHHHGSVMRQQGRRAMQRLDAIAARRYDRVVAVSDAVGRYLLEDCHVRPERLQVLRNGWAGTPQPRVPIPVPTIVSVGMFRPEKDHSTLVRALGELHRRGVPARLVLVGAGPLRRAVEAEVADLGLTESVRFTGHVDDVWPLLARADVFALASVHEPLGIAVLEAMAAGLPTVTTDVGGLPEVVDPGVTGLLTSAGDVHGLAAALADLLTDPSKRHQMGAAGRRRAQGMRADVMVAGYLDVFEAWGHRSRISLPRQED